MNALRGTFSAGAIIPAFLEPQPSIYSYGQHKKSGQGITNAIGSWLDIEKSMSTAQLWARTARLRAISVRRK